MRSRSGPVLTRRSDRCDSKAPQTPIPVGRRASVFRTLRTVPAATPRGWHRQP